MPFEHFPSFSEVIHGMFNGIKALKALKGIAAFGAFIAALVSGTAKVISWLTPKRWLLGDEHLRALDEQQRLLGDLTNAPLKDIRDAKPGEVVRFEGRIRRDRDLLESPVGKRKCVYYEVHAEQNLGEDGGVVQTFATRRTTDFYLEDSTGRVKVCGNSLKLEIDFDMRKEMAKSRLETLLGCGLPESNGGWARVEETTLSPHETISICGLLQDEPGPIAEPESSGYRQHRPRQMILKALPGQFILVTERRVEHEHEA